MTDFNTSLGLRVQDDGSVLLDTRPEHEIAGGLIHFAVLTTMAEVAAAEAVGVPVVPASIAVNLLSAAKAGKLAARARVIKKGRRLAVAEGEVYQAEKMVAKATVTFAVL